MQLLMKGLKKPLKAKEVDNLIGSLSQTQLVDLFNEQPFLGIPFSTKEGIKVKGLKHSYGVVSRQEERSVEDAVAVRLLRKAGAIPLCVTNVSELGCWWNSSNYVYGTSNNPYSLSHSPGGSSGAEAALQSSAGIPISLGSDTGGSIRTPAAFCGIFGHKPSPGTVTTKGCFVNDIMAENSMQVVGPMCKHAEDLLPLTKVLLGDNIHLLHLDREVFFTKCNFYYLVTHVGGNLTSLIDPEVKMASQRVVDFIEDNFGVIVKPLHLPELKNLYSIFSEEISRESEPLCSILSTSKEKSEVWVTLEWLKTFSFKGQHTFPVLMQLSMERIGGYLSSKTARSYEPSNELLSLRRKINSILGSDGILLGPPHPSAAPFHYQSYTKPFNFLYTALHNTLGLPATVVPLGLSAKGLPLSIQVAAAEGNDHLTIALAGQLERPFGGWCPPFTTEQHYFVDSYAC